MNSLKDDVKEAQLTVRRVGASRLVAPKREWASLLGAFFGASLGLTLISARRRLT